MKKAEKQKEIPDGTIVLPVIYAPSLCILSVTMLECIESKEFEFAASEIKFFWKAKKKFSRFLAEVWIDYKQEMILTKNRFCFIV